MQYVQERDDKGAKAAERIARMYKRTRAEQAEDWKEGKTLKGAIKVFGDKHLFFKSMQGIQKHTDKGCQHNERSRSRDSFP